MAVMEYDFITKLLPVDWFSALLVVVFFIIFQKYSIGSPWTRLVISILAAVAVKGFVIWLTPAPIPNNWVVGQ